LEGFAQTTVIEGGEVFFRFQGSRPGHFKALRAGDARQSLKKPSPPSCLVNGFPI
jgi:hypothetical protein